MDSIALAARIEDQLGSTAAPEGALRLQAPPLVADHELLRCIGAGSYGEVWLARSVTGQWRAVKVVARARFSSDRPYEREFRGVVEFEPISRAHLGLVQVLHVGRDDVARAFYYVMELADDADGGDAGIKLAAAARPADASGLPPLASYSPRTLRSDLKTRGRLPVADAVALGVELTGALGHVHRHGLVHRDVKPSNVIFVQGRPKLADLGLVTSTDEARSFVGTEGFIPPEGPGTVKADLFALGRLLYEAVTGKDRCDFPELPPDLDTWPDRAEFLEFNEIVTRLCAPDPASRYANAAEVAGDLNLILAGRSVRRANGVERRLRQARQIGVSAAVVLAVAAGVVWIQQTRRKDAEARATHEQSLRQRAVAAEQDSRQQLYTALLEQARATVRSGETGQRVRALDAVQRAAAIRNTAELRREALAALALPDLRLEREIRFDTAQTLMQPDPGFERIALSGGSGGSGPVTIHSLPNLELLATLPASADRPTHLSEWSKDGRYLAVRRDHPTGRADWEMWDVDRTKHLFTVGPDASYRSVTFHPQRALFLAGHAGGRVTEWDLESGQMVREFRLPDTLHALAYSPDGGRFAACYRTEASWSLAFHNATSRELLRAVELPEPLDYLTWHPQGRWVTGHGSMASAWTRRVQLIEAETGGITVLGEHKIKTSFCGFTADGNFLATCGWDREAIFWDLRTLQRAFSHVGTRYKIEISADGRSCAFPLQDNMMQYFKLEQPGHRELSGNAGDIFQMGQMSPDGRWLAARDDRNLYVWQLDLDAPSALLAVPPKTTSFFTPDSRELFAVPEQFQDQGYLGRWQLTAGAEAGEAPKVDPLPVHFPRGLTRAAPAGDEVLMTSAEGVRFVARANLATGEGRVAEIPAGLGQVSPDSRWLAMLYDFSKTVRVYRLPAVEEVASLETGNFVMFITFSPEGDEMLVINRSGVEWFDTRTWKLTRRQAGSPVAGSYAIYTPDGTGIWMVTHSRHAALLDRRTLEPVLPLPNDVLPLAVSPDGSKLAISAGGRQVRLWQLAELREQLRALGLDWADEP
jgi:WD40 repeat protein